LTEISKNCILKANKSIINNYGLKVA